MIKKLLTMLLCVSLITTGTITGNAATTAESNDPLHYTYQLRNDPQYDSLYSKDNNLLISVSYDQLHTVSLTNPDTGLPFAASQSAVAVSPSAIGVSAVTHSAISAALKTINRDVRKDDASFVKQNKKMAQKDYKARKADDTFAPYECSDRLIPVRADNRVLSINRIRYIDMDGAHGSNLVTAYNYDASTGKRLKLKDVLKYKSKSRLTQILANEVINQYGTKRLDLWKTKSALKKRINELIKGINYKGSNDTKNLTWYIDRDGISFFFNEYDIASFAAGTFSVKLTADKYPDMVNTYYTDSPENYVIDTDNTTEASELKKLSINEQWDDYDTISKVTIKYGKKSLSIKPYALRMDSKLIVTSSGKYLCLTTTHENDYQMTHIIDLNAKKLKDKETDGGFYDIIPTDPEALPIAARTGILGTVNIIRPYRIDNGGELLPDTSYYLVESPILTLKQEASLDVLYSPELDMTKPLTFPAGTKLTIFRTNGNNIVDCLTSDGYLIRLNVDQSAYPEKINGTYNADDLLDGISYAG